MVNRFCVFCGKRPESKNREHVVPSWLIRLTGDPNRTVFLGHDWTTPDLKERRFALDAYTFPACEECNQRFSDLEAQAQSIVETILAREGVSAEQWDTFLDWLDKVRTGLWLGMLYLNQNHLGIDPHFFIESRIGWQDRFVIIYEIEDDGRTGVGWSGPDSPVFESMPSCFTLTINQFHFLSASSDFLFSRRFGFPYPLEREMRADGGCSAEMAAGTGIHKLPLVKRKFPAGGTTLWQPMILRNHVGLPDSERAGLSALYENDFVRGNCMDFAAGVGRVFLRKRGELVPYPSSPSMDWIPRRSMPRGEVLHRTAVASGRFLEALFVDHASLGSLPDEMRTEYREQIEGAVAVHRAIMDQLVAQKHKFY